MKTKHVYLGRFAPFHNGHGRLLKKLVEINGEENVLVMVGTSNSVNRRTPYTYEDRAEIVRVSFPNVEIVPLPDGRPGLEYFDGSTNDIWLDNIERIAGERDEKFVFYGGALVDLEVLAERFETKVLVNRTSPSEMMSATEVREVIKTGDIEALKKLVDPKALDLIISKYKSI